jgi:predicted nuclease of restriction endonuclease-like (RecB) superfamily
MIIELKVTQERINHFWKIVEAIRQTEKNISNYKDSAGGFLAEIEKMNTEVYEFLSIHPSEFDQESQAKIAA